MSLSDFEKFCCTNFCGLAKIKKIDIHPWTWFMIKEYGQTCSFLIIVDDSLLFIICWCLVFNCYREINLAELSRVLSFEKKLTNLKHWFLRIHFCWLCNIFFSTNFWLYWSNPQKLTPHELLLHLSMLLGYAIKNLQVSYTFILKSHTCLSTLTIFISWLSLHHFYLLSSTKSMSISLQ